jgi:hypothetical protein
MLLRTQRGHSHAPQQARAAARGVNEGYITRDKLLNDLLRKQQERISAVVMERAEKSEGGLALHWLKSAKVDMPAGSTQTREETRRLAA